MDIEFQSTKPILVGSEWIDPPEVPEPDIPTYTIEVAYNNSITTAIIVISIIIIGSFIVWLLILVFNDIPPATLGQCLPDKCATNITSGVKRCPPPGESTTYILGIEVCNSRFVCDNSVTPLSEQLDGSTNITGICPSNVECRCLRNGANTIPTYIVSTFSGVNGNPYTSLSNQRLTFTQSLIPSLTQLPNVTTEFFAVPSTWLARSSPGCGEIPVVIDFSQTGPTGGDYQRDILKTCFNDINPCLQGSLSFIPASSTLEVTARDLNSMAYSCVKSQTCKKQFGEEGRDRILIRDFLSGEFLCYNVDDIN